MSFQNNILFSEQSLLGKEDATKTAELIEGVLFLIFGLVGIAEGGRLVLYKDPYIFYDPLGPGLYIIAVSIGLMIIGLLHIAVNSRKLPNSEKASEGIPINRELRIKLISTILVCGIYIFLISYIGYLLATILFFFIELKIEGIKSWPLVVVLSLAFSSAYYFIFVKYCNLVFPRGIFF